VFCDAGLVPEHQPPAHVCDRLVAPTTVPGLLVRPPLSAGEFLLAYGEALAPPVTAADLAAADRGWGPVWLHATETSAPIYRRLGYRLVDGHGQLAPSRS
jgi:hypothetical protein